MFRRRKDFIRIFADDLYTSLEMTPRGVATLSTSLEFLAVLRKLRNFLRFYGSPQQEGVLSAQWEFCAAGLSKQHLRKACILKDLLVFRDSLDFSSFAYCGRKEDVSITVENIIAIAEDRIAASAVYSGLEILLFSVPDLLEVLAALSGYKICQQKPWRERLILPCY